ncbi:MAG: phosphoglycerate dehydrogenase [Opitutales bacterium]
MKVLVADKISPIGVAYFKDQSDLEVIEAYGSTPEQILELAKDVAAIVVRSETKVTAEVIAAAPELKAVGRAGVGVDNIDIDAATERGIVVMNTPGGNTVATAELTFTHMLCGTRPIAQASSAMKSGKWDRKKYPGVELSNKTLGILGLGRIGREVAARAQAFGMKVLAFDPFLTEARARDLRVQPVDQETIFREADYITVHMPLTDETKYMVDAEAIALMKDGVRLFNCARGGIIEEAALIEGLKSGKVGAAGLDVYEDEPLAEDSPLRTMENVVLTPHLGASTREAQESVGLEIAENITQALRTGEIRNAVNMPSVDARTLEILRPYLRLGEQIGTLVQQLAPTQVQNLKVTYWGKAADLDAMPLNRAIQRGFLDKFSGAEVNDVNAPKKLKELGVQVEFTKSSTEADYTELVQVEAFCKDGESVLAAGTLIGKVQNPRVVQVKEYAVEFEPFGVLLFLKNRDQPGIVGHLGTILAEEQVNIANLSLARHPHDRSGAVRAVYTLDSEPSAAAFQRILGHDGVLSAKVVHL